MKSDLCIGDVVEARVQRVDDWMVPVSTVNPLCVDKHMPLRDAIKFLSANALSAVVVLEREEVVGILSEHDLIRVISEYDYLPAELMVIDAMTSIVCTISPDETCERALSLMTDRGFRHLPVILDRKFVGLLSILNAATGRMLEFGLLANDMLKSGRKKNRSFAVLNLSDSVNSTIEAHGLAQGFFVEMGNDTYSFIHMNDLLRAKLRQ